MVLATLLALFVPAVALGVLIINALGALGIATLQIVSVFTKPITRPRPMNLANPFVSIHVPCHNEPPQIVKQTLQHLADLDYENYEVLVIDNNTRDPKLWQPLQQLCQGFGPRFRFFHVENLTGYKAGALNWALGKMDKRTEIIATVDADYLVQPQFLAEGTAYFTDPHVGIVQYPQAYHNVTTRNQPLELEYRSHFDNILEQANSFNAVTATGTLSLLRAHIFTTGQNQWNTWCVTEDAEISVHLHGLGYRSIFINQRMGEGLMPFNYYSLRRQRERWTHGNTQIIRKDIWSIIQNSHLNVRQKVSFLTQLTAWLHPNLLPLIFLIPTLVLLTITPDSFLRQLIIFCSLATIIGFAAGKTVYFAYGLRRRGIRSWRLALATLLTHFGLTVTMSVAWLKALFSPNLPFNRTSKDTSERITHEAHVDVVVVGLLLLVSLFTTIAAPTPSLRLAAACSFVIAVFLAVAIAYATWQTRNAQQAAAYSFRTSRVKVASTGTSTVTS